MRRLLSRDQEEGRTGGWQLSGRYRRIVIPFVVFVVALTVDLSAYRPIYPLVIWLSPSLGIHLVEVSLFPLPSIHPRLLFLRVGISTARHQLSRDPFTVILVAINVGRGLNTLCCSRWRVGRSSAFL